MKYYTLVISLLILAFALGACTSPNADANDSRFSSDHVYIIDDYDTECKYLAKTSGGITPLLRSDGTPDCGVKGILE